MKKGKRIIIFLSAVLLFSSQAFAEGLREIKTLDEEKILFEANQYMKKAGVL